MKAQLLNLAGCMISAYVAKEERPEDGSNVELVEAIDMARRGIHDEGAELLRERIADKVETDLQRG